jgi:hypothetical protein
VSNQETTTHFFFWGDILVLFCHVFVGLVKRVGTNTQQAFQGVGGGCVMLFFGGLRILQILYMEHCP